MWRYKALYVYTLLFARSMPSKYGLRLLLGRLGCDKGGEVVTAQSTGRQIGIVEGALRVLVLFSTCSMW